MARAEVNPPPPACPALQTSISLLGTNERLPLSLSQNIKYPPDVIMLNANKDRNYYFNFIQWNAVGFHGDSVISLSTIQGTYTVCIYIYILLLKQPNAHGSFFMSVTHLQAPPPTQPPLFADSLSTDLSWNCRGQKQPVLYR